MDWLSVTFQVEAHYRMWMDSKSSLESTREHDWYEIVACCTMMLPAYFFQHCFQSRSACTSTSHQLPLKTLDTPSASGIGNGCIFCMFTQLIGHKVKYTFSSSSCRLATMAVAGSAVADATHSAVQQEQGKPTFRYVKDRSGIKAVRLPQIPPNINPNPTATSTSTNVHANDKQVVSPASGLADSNITQQTIKTATSPSNHTHSAAPTHLAPTPRRRVKRSWATGLSSDAAVLAARLQDVAATGVASSLASFNNTAKPSMPTATTGGVADGSATDKLSQKVSNPLL